MDTGVSTACQTRVRSQRLATEAERRDASRVRARHRDRDVVGVRERGLPAYDERLGGIKPEP